MADYYKKVIYLSYLEQGNRRLEVLDSMEPVELTPEVVGMVDGDGGAWLMRFEVWEVNS